MRIWEDLVEGLEGEAGAGIQAAFGVVVGHVEIEPEANVAL